MAVAIKLYEVSGQLDKASCVWVRKLVEHQFPEKTAKEVAYITNVIVTMVVEFNLTSSCHPMKHCCPVVAPFIEDKLIPIEEYLSEEEQGWLDNTS